MKTLTLSDQAFAYLQDMVSDERSHEVDGCLNPDKDPVLADSIITELEQALKHAAKQP